MKRIVYILVLFILCFKLDAYSQGENPVTDNIVSGLKTLSGNHIIERAYLHFDKPWYMAGDTMYFKAYVTLGEHTDLSKASGILHVDLIDPNNSILSSIKLPLGNGITWGDFSIPVSYRAGNYRVRAWTNYMQNAPDYFFDKTITISSPISAATSNVTAQNEKPDLQFFPEGGELVDFMGSKVAFKALAPSGLGISVKGVIVDNAGKQVETFSSNHLGMGTFTLLPEEGKSYKARVTFADGSQNTFDLPQAINKGILLAVKDTLDKLSVEVHSNKAYFQDNANKNISLVIYGSGYVNTVNTKLDSRRLSMDIPNSQFPSGVVQITLFSSDGKPLSERLVFLKNPDLVNLTLASNKTSYGKRDRVSFTMNAKTKGVEAEGHFSVSVIDEGRVPFDENKETTILTYLLLSSELRGYIEQPNYYFKNDNGETTADLDALMLTQGYRRFAWKDLLNGETAKFNFEPERALEITGIAKTESGTPVSDMDVMLTTSTSQGGMMGDKTGPDGKFKFVLQPFADSSLFILQATGSTKTKKTTVFTVDGEKPGPGVSGNASPGTQNDHIITAANPNGSQVQNSVPAGNYDQTITGAELLGSGSLTTALSKHLRGVNFVQNVPYLKGQSTKDPMLIVFNGKIVGSDANLNSIDPGSIAKVEVLRGNAASDYGIYGNAGVLRITSKDGNAGSIIQDASYRHNSRNTPQQKMSYVNDKNNYRSSNYGGAGHADHVVKGDMLKNSPSLSQGLNGLLPDISFFQGIPYLNTSKIVTGSGESNQPMLVMLEGSELAMGSSGIDIINPLEVETVEELKGPSASIYGMNGGAGVLVITLRQGAAHVDNDKTALGSLSFRPKGFYMSRQFYSPKYENKTIAGNDQRSTIYWNPEVVTNKDGNASFEYYNSDGHGSFRVVVEGIDNNGHIGRQVFRYKVE